MINGPSLWYSGLPGSGLLISAATVVLQLAPSVIPEKPAWVIAISLFCSSLVLIGNVLVKIIRASKTNGTNGNRLDRAQIKEEVTTFGLVADTHELVTALAAANNQITAALSNMAQHMLAKQKVLELHTGMIDTLLQNQDQLQRITAANAERLNHVATKADLLAEGVEIRHDLRNTVQPVILALSVREGFSLEDPKSPGGV